MPQEMVQEAVEIVTMSVDKFINVKNYEVSVTVLFVRCVRLSRHRAVQANVVVKCCRMMLWRDFQQKLAQRCHRKSMQL